MLTAVLTASMQLFRASGAKQLSHDRRGEHWNSVCGGAGGYWTRISMGYASSVPGTMTKFLDSLCISKRENMEDLNGRFASYMENLNEITLHLRCEKVSFFTVSLKNYHSLSPIIRCKNRMIFWSDAIERQPAAFKYNQLLWRDSSLSG